MPLKPHPTDPDKLVYESRRYMFKDWVGLTQNEIKSCWLGYEARGYPPERVMMFYKLVEQMLKEKNT